MKSSLFPDVNVWLALTYERHAHHATVRRWLDSEADPQLYFCRFTQLGLLRLLTNEQVMAEDVLSQRKAWQAYRRWLEDARVDFHREPEAAEFETLFEELSTRSHPATKLWADAYLAAFAKSSGLTLVTFDRALERTKHVSIRILSPG
ncbi:MAG: PIN domain-containing protein [Candidatus Solibacter usitatus]|nr:PIN domain-containing protein [Candidatus Solibacter usitatus]